LVVITADEPGMHSSQNEQDNRLYAPHAKVALIEPSDSQECKDYLKRAFEISEQFDTAVLFRVTTRVCHTKGVVELGEREEVGIREYIKNPKK
jgi:Indolepyruvate ferredoxin oxidoreductase, alpha and beta subunits